MKNLIFRLQSRLKQEHLLGVILFLLIFWMPGWFRQLYPTAGWVDEGIWSVLLLAVLCFLIILSLSYWLFLRSWQSLGLPNIEHLVSQFKSLNLWQQFVLCWLSFALVLLAGLISLIAIF